MRPRLHAACAYAAIQFSERASARNCMIDAACGRPAIECTPREREKVPVLLQFSERASLRNPPVTPTLDAHIDNPGPRQFAPTGAPQHEIRPTVAPSADVGCVGIY